MFSNHPTESGIFHDRIRDFLLSFPSSRSLNTISLRCICAFLIDGFCWSNLNKVLFLKMDFQIISRFGEISYSIANRCLKLLLTHSPQPSSTRSTRGGAVHVI